jgi:hypothetical protein
MTIESKISSFSGIAPFHNAMNRPGFPGGCHEAEARVVGIEFRARRLDWPPSATVETR